MARIRSIHPGFFTDEAIVSASPQAQIFLIGVWTQCDDQGVFEWKPVTLKMRILPASNCDVTVLLAELISLGIVKQIDVGPLKYGLVRNFRKYQRPKKPNSTYPLPSEFRTYVGLTGDIPEPSNDKDGPSSPPVPHQSSTGSEISPQMEEGGGRMEEGEEDHEGEPASPDGADAPSPPPIDQPSPAPPEPEPEPGLEAEPENDPFPPLAFDRSPEAEALNLWNAAADRVGWPKAQRLTDTRRRALKLRLSECGGLEGWSDALAKAEASSFLTGKSGRTNGHENWRCDLDFILRQAKFTKLLEGGFDDPADGLRQRPQSNSEAIFRGAMSVAGTKPLKGILDR